MTKREQAIRLYYEAEFTDDPRLGADLCAQADALMDEADQEAEHGYNYDEDEDYGFEDEDGNEYDFTPDFDPNPEDSDG